jgi:hypothetical protein
MMASRNAPPAQCFIKRAPASPASANSFPNQLSHGRPFESRRQQLRKSGSWIFALAIASAMLMASDIQSACADLLIEGDPHAIHLEVRGVPLRQLLDAMQAKFNLHYRSDDALNSPVTGTFDGQLRRLVGRLLEDYDFVMKMTPDGLDVLIMQRNQGDIKAAVASFPAKDPTQANVPMTTAQEANR